MSAKQAWDILHTTQEGAVTVKQSKLQRLATTFETLRMDDNETFDEFFAKLSDVVNSWFNLSEIIPENLVARKIMRSLPDRFQSKVVTIKETKDLDALRVD